jgi:hypothetical protein
MRYFALIVAALVTLASCTAPSKITASWKNPTEANRNYKVIFVAAMTKNNIVRSTFESDIAAELNKNNVRTLKSIDEFPPQFSKDSIPKDALMSAVKKDGSEAILTITILKKTTESRYVSGGYYPGSRFGYYGNFWGYYNYWYPYAYDDSYYVMTDVYYIETNLYDSKTELLLWSAQTRSYTYEGINSFSKELATVVVEKLKSDKLISSPAKTKDEVYSSK